MMLLEVCRFATLMNFSVGNTGLLRRHHPISFLLLEALFCTFLVVITIVRFLARMHLTNTLSLLVIRSAGSCLGTIPSHVNLNKSTAWMNLPALLFFARTELVLIDAFHMLNMEKRTIKITI